MKSTSLLNSTDQQKVTTHANIWQSVVPFRNPFTKIFKNINISLSNIGITMYLNYDDTGTKNPITKKRSNFFKELRQHFPITTIDEDDYEHEMFHTDDFDPNQTHYHFSFNEKFNLLKLENFQWFIEKLEYHELISPAEKNDCLAEFQQRQKKYQAILEQKFTKDKELDTKEIINSIKNCNDNDILVNLHAHLLSAQFEYLRLTNIPTIFWVGTDQKQAIVPTSEAWAMIEKSISLQLAFNIKFFSDHELEDAEKVIPTQIKGLASHNRFFAIKRKANEISQSKMFEDACLGTEDGLPKFNKRYLKHFKKFR